MAQGDPAETRIVTRRPGVAAATASEACAVTQDPIVTAALRRLRRASTFEHSGRSFLEHLLGTWRILVAWRQPPAVCHAGLLHSAYSTSSYPHALFRFAERLKLMRMIGEEAEELVFRFCTMERRGFWDGLAHGPRPRRLTYPSRLNGCGAVRVSRSTLEKLLMIESANHAEQAKAADFGPAPWMSRLTHWWQFLDERAIPLGLGVRPVLTRREDEEAIQIYRSALNAPVRRAIPLLERAMRRNPWAAEPALMRALCAVQLREDERARLYARQGVGLLIAWATPWDKRLTLDGWSALAQRIESASRNPPANLNFDYMCAALDERARMPLWLLV